MKEIAVIGLGKFGVSVAKKYMEMGGNVLAIDDDEEKAQEISDSVTYAVKADMTDVDVVKSLGLSNMDVVVVAITDNMEAAVMAVILAKEEGVPLVIAKSRSEIHEKVLKKVGADIVVFPEKETGYKVARKLAADNLVDLIDLSDNYCVAEVKIPEKWVGKNLIELKLRKRYGLNVVLKKNGDEIDSRLDPEMPLEGNCTLVVIGELEVIERIFR